MKKILKIKVKQIQCFSRYVKKCISMILAIILMVALCGCENSEESQNKKDNNSVYNETKDNNSETRTDFKTEENENSRLLAGVAINSISLGNFRSAAITENDKLFVWGWGQNNESKAAQTTPREILDDVSYVALGNDYLTAAINKYGKLFIWDYYDGGKLDVPHEIMSDVVCVSVSGESYNNFFECAAITSDHSLYAWDGKDVKSAYKILEDCIQVSLGKEHGMALTSDGSLYVWGYGYNGQLGNGAHSGLRIDNEPESGYYEPFKLMDDVRYIECGEEGSAAITKNDELYVWGNNNSGALGTNDKENYWRGDIIKPTKLMDNVKTVELNYNTGCAISNNGDLYTWGYYADQYRGFLKDVTSRDFSVPVKIMENVSDVSIGKGNLAILTGDGSLYMYGENSFGQLGNGTTEGVYDDVVKIMDNIRVISE